MADPLNWRQLIDQLAGAQSIWGTALFSGGFSTNATTGFEDFGVPFQKGNGMISHGSGAVAGISVVTAGWYEVHYSIDFADTAPGFLRAMVVRAMGSDAVPAGMASSGSGTAPTNLTGHNTLQFPAGNSVRLQVDSGTESVMIVTARLTARYLGPN